MSTATQPDYKTQFQTPANVARYMVSLLPPGVKTVLEPTPGLGSIVRALQREGYLVTAPDNFFDVSTKERFDAVVMNPPFSSKYAFGVPRSWKNKKGMVFSYHLLARCMDMSDNVIALMPWFALSDSDKRSLSLKEFGLVSVTTLPRKTFDYARIQTVVIQMRKGYQGSTELKLCPDRQVHMQLF